LDRIGDRATIIETGNESYRCSMNEILEIGQVLELDDKGFIINQSNLDKIVDPWWPVVEAVKEGYINNLGDKAHSIYIRGSVARGQAREQISDVDSLAVVHGKQPDLEWAAGLTKDLVERFPFCAGVEIVCLPYDELLHSDDNANASWRMMLKTQCVCVFGEDLAARLPSYRPGADMVVHANDVRRPIERLSDDLRALAIIGRLPFSARFFKSLSVGCRPVVRLGCAEIMKRIIRAGFEVVMEEEGVYTRDLYPCYKIFSKHFPEKERSMRTALDLAVNPTSDPQELLSFLDDFGPWIIAKAEDRYGNSGERAGLGGRLLSMWRDLTKVSKLAK
jgi:predicted nucleotidyltransferase